MVSIEEIRQDIFNVQMELMSLRHNSDVDRRRKLLIQLKELKSKYKIAQINNKKMKGR